MTVELDQNELLTCIRSLIIYKLATSTTKANEKDASKQAILQQLLDSTEKLNNKLQDAFLAAQKPPVQ